MKVLIIAILISIMPICILAEDNEQNATQEKVTLNSQEDPLYQEESDNDSQFNDQQWQVFKGNCPLETPGSLSYKEEQERKARKKNNSNIFH